MLSSSLLSLVIHLSRTIHVVDALSLPVLSDIVDVANSIDPILALDTCVSLEPSSNVSERITQSFQSGGPGTTVSLCPSTTYPLYDTINFTASNQELSTLGYPSDETRAIFTVAGAIDKTNHGMSTAIDASCDNCDGAIVKNIQVDGNRTGPPVGGGGALLEMGGATTSQTVQYVHSFHPRGWTCLHFDEGNNLSCKNATITNNDIGPCGVSTQSQWADGISLSCAASTVENNVISGPTDGGIVIFGSPGSTIKGNTITIGNETLLGGINLVDYGPWNGNDSGVIVEDNTIVGGVASRPGSPDSSTGPSDSGAFIKIGIAIGPRTWFGNQYNNSVISGPTVSNNILAGAMGYGIALSAASNIVVQGNTLSNGSNTNNGNALPNAAFIGQPGPKCSNNATFPSPQSFIADTSLLTNYVIQDDFNKSAVVNYTICIQSLGSDINAWPVSSGNS